MKGINLSYLLQINLVKKPPPNNVLSVRNWSFCPQKKKSSKKKKKTPKSNKSPKTPTKMPLKDKGDDFIVFYYQSP